MKQLIIHWVGYITKVNENNCDTILKEKGSTGEEYLSIPIEDFGDQPIDEGDLFDLKLWDNPEDKELVVRERKPFTKEDITEATKWAEKMLKGINFK